MMPLAPSTSTSRASAAVAATRAMREAVPRATLSRTQPTRLAVLPKPRPASNSHPNQAPAGASCEGRAFDAQLDSSASAIAVASERFSVIGLVLEVRLG